MRSEMRAVALSLTCIGSTVVVDAVGLTLGAGGDASGGHGVAEALEFGVAGWGGGTRGGPSRAGGGSRAGRGAEGDVQRGGSRARRARGGPAARVSWSTQLRLEVEVDVLLVRAERLLGEGDAGAALAVMEELIGVQEGSGVVLPDDFGLRYARVALAAGGAERALASLREYLGTVARGTHCIGRGWSCWRARNGDCSGRRGGPRAKCFRTAVFARKWSCCRTAAWRLGGTR